MKTDTSAQDSAPNKTPAILAATNQEVPCDQIVPDPNNRDTIDNERVASLARSIADEGLLQPVLLLELGPGKYRMIAGEHRWRAHLKLKMATISARVYRNETDLSAARKKAVENFQRTQLTPIEEAKKYRELQDLGMKQGEIGELLGRSQPVIANAMRILELPSAAQDIVRQDGLSMAHAVSLCRFAEYPKVCAMIARLAAENGTPSKDLDKGLPFAARLEKEKLAVRMGWHGREDLPAQSKKDFQFLEGGSQYQTSLYCLDVEGGRKVMAEIEAKEKAEREAQEAKYKDRTARTADGKMADSAKAERKRVIVQNKKNRAATAAVLEAACARLKDVQSIDSRSLAVIVNQAIATSHAGSRLAPAAKQLGVNLPKGLSFSSYSTSTASLEKLVGMKPEDLLRVVALAITTGHAEQAIAHASSIPAEATILAGPSASQAIQTAHKAAVAPKEKPKEVAKPASKRAKITDETYAAVKKLVEAGKTGSEVARQLGISLPTVQNMKSRLGLVIHRR